MKVLFSYENKDFKKHSDFVKNFAKLLQREFPLKNDLTIFFLDKQKGKMSTGSRRSDNVIKVLVGDRMNRDIMRTLAHEWVHEHQMDVLKREKGPDIGGRNEDEANAFAGRLVKMFEKENPDYEPKMYENKGIQKRLNLLTESIILTEKYEIEKNLIVEMKKIGIEKLPYSYSSLSRFIDSKTMDVHYNKHYKGYVDKLNKELKNKNGNLDLEEIIKSISKFNDKVRNNAGGAFNHAMFWKMLSPKKQKPSGNILKQINKDFGNIRKMKDEFNQAAKDRFGSGWAWLFLNKDGKLKITSTPNQDNPLMDIVKSGGYPILGLDVWEHAYYLKYQNKRDEYIKKFWDVVNWNFVEELYNMNSKNKELKESTKPFISESKKTEGSRIDYLCGFATKRKIENSPYCKLKDIKDDISDESLKESLENSIIILDNFFRNKNVGVFPAIVNLALKSEERLVSYLKLIAEFINNDDYDEDVTKKTLNKFRNSKIVPNNITDITDTARLKEYQKYEKRFHGKFFKAKPTSLRLNYHCSDDAKEKLIDSLIKIHNKKETINYHFFRIVGCLSQSFKSGSYYIKSDLETIEDFKNEEGDVVFPKGSLFEVKKMDPFVDSYLSEFFSIFKESAIADKKPIVNQLYNDLIDKIYNWLIKNQTSTDYLSKVKDQMSGIIYENDLIIPIEYIELYWSNKGQRGCDERRLSIRFRIKPEYSEVVGYKFVDEDTLETVKLNVPSSEKQLVICE